jgi:hypothetical protein
MASRTIRESPPASPNQPQIPLNSRFLRRVAALFWPSKIASRLEHYTDDRETGHETHEFLMPGAGRAALLTEATSGNIRTQALLRLADADDRSSPRHEGKDIRT